MKKRLLLLRHASHVATHPHRFFGKTDVCLSHAGHLQASSIAPLVQAYRPERCFCSPLRRCIDTVDPIPGIQPDLNSDLREIDFGRWEGMTFDEIQQSDPAAVDRWANFDPAFSFPGGECISDFLARVSRTAEVFTSCSEKTVLAVTHGGIIRALICHFLGLHPRQYVLFNILFASLTTLDLFGGKGVLTGLNLGGRGEEI